MNTHTPFDNPDHAARSVVAHQLARHLSTKTAPAVSVRNVIASLFSGEPLGQAEADALKLGELLAGEEQLGRAVIPWASLTKRAMSTATGPKGGYAAAVEVGPLADALRTDSAIIAAGAQVFENLRAVQAIPRVSGKATTYWLAQGAAPASTSDLTLGLASATPHTLMVRTSISEQLLRQSSVEALLPELLRRDVGEALDAAAVNGAGGTAPLGIVNTTGVGSASGTSLSYATIYGQIEALVGNGARTSDLFMLAGRTAGRILATRERAAGSGYILDGGQIAGIPATISNNVPASTLVIGTATQLAVAAWGGGVTVETNRSTGFNTATVDLRVMLDCDIILLQPSAFVVFGTVT